MSNEPGGPEQVSNEQMMPTMPSQGGAPRSEPQGVDPQTFAEYFSRLPEALQQKFLSDPEHKEGVMQMLEAAGVAGEALERRLIQDPENTDVVDEGGKEDVRSIFEQYVPESGLNEDQKTELISNMGILANKIANNETSTGEDLYADFGKNLEAIGVKKRGKTLAENQAIVDGIKSAYPTVQFTDEQLSRIISNLPLMTDVERQEAERQDREEKTEEEKGLESKIDTLASTVKELTDPLQQATETRMRQLRSSSKPEDQNALKQLEARIRKLGRLTDAFTHLKDFFGRDTEGRKWARRVGKTIYFSLIILFLIIILEMNMINKMSRKPGR